MAVPKRRLSHSRRRNRRLALALTLVALAAAAYTYRWLVLRGLAERQGLCAAAAHNLAGVWDPDRKEAVRKAMLATGLAYADDTWQRVAGRLDDYTAAWVPQHGDACQATYLRGEQSPALLDRRMACLDTRGLVDLEDPQGGGRPALEAELLPDSIGEGLWPAGELEPADAHHGPVGADGDLVALVGSSLVGYFVLGIEWSTMYFSFADNLAPADFFHGVTKSAAFGVAIALSACHSAEVRGTSGFGVFRM